MSANEWWGLLSVVVGIPVVFFLLPLICDPIEEWWRRRWTDEKKSSDG